MFDNQVSFHRYPRFFIVGSAVGVATVLMRELISLILGSDGKTEYLMTICGAYAFGIIASFILQSRFIFNKQAEDASGSQFVRFVVIAMAGGGLVAILSFLLRYAFLVNLTVAILNQYAATIAFVTATLLVSLISYWVNATFVFRQ